MKVVYTPSAVNPPLLEWLTQGSNYGPSGENFIRHILSWREVRDLQGDEGVIIIEHDATFITDFRERLREIIPSIPPGIDLVLLGYQGKARDMGVDLFSPVDGNIKGSFGYWIRLSHLRHLLALYDYPLHSILVLELSPETLTRHHQKIVCLTHPLVQKDK